MRNESKLLSMYFILPSDPASVLHFIFDLRNVIYVTDVVIKMLSQQPNVVCNNGT